ncbi:hypothetical protein EVAR_33479_1 [Eumeta japonica]|uniref:Uncharacterized protein n=1 Tax=Eumeta variegata TaxID=151549 RepID=A0A4C1WHZ3_EUMVA|nr:hypothetical protein EVAR_33479_1 [Eumeta japonica]
MDIRQSSRGKLSNIHGKLEKRRAKLRCQGKPLQAANNKESFIWALDLCLPRPRRRRLFRVRKEVLSKKKIKGHNRCSRPSEYSGGCSWANT